MVRPAVDFWSTLLGFRCVLMSSNDKQVKSSQVKSKLLKTSFCSLARSCENVTVVTLLRYLFLKGKHRTLIHSFVVAYLCSSPLV